MKPVVFVGAGPGAADLITLRGAQRLAQADVVLHDALTDPALRAMAPQATWIDVGKRGFCDSTGQTRINALLVRHALEGRAVVRLKGGDPSVFGRLEEELQALADAGMQAEVVPGVTAALAAAATLQRPLTRRGTGRSVALTTAMTRSGDLRAARSADTEVFYMAGRQLGALARRLQDAGWPADTPARGVASRLARPDRHRPPSPFTRGSRPAARRPTHRGHGGRGCAGCGKPAGTQGFGQGQGRRPHRPDRPKIRALCALRRPEAEGRPPYRNLRHRNDPRRHRILHPLQVHRLRRCLPRRLLPRGTQLPRHRPGRVHRLRRVHPRVPGQRDPARGRRAPTR
jgi:uroporphyrin-III C-methyltransferase